MAYNYLQLDSFLLKRIIDGTTSFYLFMYWYTWLIFIIIAIA